MIKLFMLVIVALIGFGILKWVSYLRKAVREDKIAQLEDAQEHLNIALAAGAVAAEVTDEEREKLAEAQRNVHERIDLGKQARKQH
jgi:hypothetical protein